MKDFQSYENYFIYFQMSFSLLANIWYSKMSSFTMFYTNTYLSNTKVWDCY